MSTPGAEPRVDARTISQHRGGTVRLTAKVIQIRGDQATVEAADGGQVIVALSRDTHIEDPFVEIIGQVKDDGTLKALTAINMGKNLDLAAVQAVVELTHSSKGVGVLTERS